MISCVGGVRPVGAGTQNIRDISHIGSQLMAPESLTLTTVSIVPRR